MQFQIGNELCEDGFEIQHGHVDASVQMRVEREIAEAPPILLDPDAEVKHMVFPAFVLCVILMVALDMLDQGTVPVAKVLPPLVVVRLAVHGEVNAELGLVIARFVLQTP